MPAASYCTCPQTGSTELWWSLKKKYQLLKDFSTSLPPGHLSQMSKSLDDKVFAFSLLGTAAGIAVGYGVGAQCLDFNGLSLEAQEWKLLSKVDGRSTLEEVRLLAGLRADEAESIVGRLMEAGLLEMRARR